MTPATIFLRLLWKNQLPQPRLFSLLCRFKKCVISDALNTDLSQIFIGEKKLKASETSKNQTSSHQT